MENLIVGVFAALQLYLLKRMDDLDKRLDLLCIRVELIDVHLPKRASDKPCRDNGSEQ